MTYPILVIRRPDETPDPLFPQPALEPDSVELTPEDGNVATFRCSGLRTQRRVDGNFVTMGELGRSPATAFITDGRLAVACSKYEKGRVWRGWGPMGVIVAGIATLVSTASAAQRRQGQMLVGHVRYEWLTGVIAREGQGSKNPVIQLLMRDPTEGGVVQLQLHLNRSDVAHSKAEEIVSRAARHQSALAEAGDLRTALEAFAESPVSKTSEKAGVLSWVLPQG
jgi:hypothetical protein